MNNRRQLRLGSLLRSVIADTLLFRLRDPRLQGLISVTQVVVSPDQTEATVHVSILGTDAEQASSLETLEHARGAFMAAIRDQCQLRILPRLHFKLDRSIEKAHQINQLLNRALGTGPNAQPDAEEDEDVEEEASDVADEDSVGDAADVSDDEAGEDEDEADDKDPR